MIIGLDLRYVYVSCPKAGTHTMFWLLKEKFGGQHVNVLQGCKRMQFHHAREIPPGYRKFFKFSVVRNPFSRAVSLWWIFRGGKNCSEFTDYRGWYLGVVPDDSFLTFTKWAVGRRWKGKKRDFFMYPQSEWLERVPLDVVIKIEELEDRFNEFAFVKAHLAETREKRITIPRVMAREKNRPHWSTYYQGKDGEQARRNVMKWAGRDFLEYDYPQEIPEATPQQ